MNAFRVLALAYALVALLIAPSWLAAEDEVVPAPAPAAAPAAPAPPPDPAAEPAAEQPPSEAPVAVAQEAQPAAADDDPAAKDAKPDEPRKEDRPVVKAAASGSVTITDFEYTPATITVNEGDTVTWTNKGPTPHTATAEDGSFDTGNLDTGERGSATFTQAGTIAYICTPHPFMKGKVVVRGASAGSDDGGADDTGDAAADTDTDAADGLPATGTETLLIALLGFATLGAGILLRRRGAPDSD